MPLTSVLVVCRSHSICGSSLPHLIVLLSEFLVNLSSLRLPQVVQHGSLALVQYLSSEQFENTFSRSELIQAFQLACGIVGDLTIVKCLHQRLASQMHLSSLPWDAAASKGRLEIAQWLVNSRQHEQFSELALESACKHGHVAMVRFLIQYFGHQVRAYERVNRKHRQHNIVTRVVAPATATVRGRRVCMVVPSASITTCASAAGVKSSASSSNCQFKRKSALEIAARHGHVSVVQYLLTQGFDEFTIPALHEAARGGSVDTLLVLLHSLADQQLQPHEEEEEEDGENNALMCDNDACVGHCCWCCLMEAALRETQVQVCEWLFHEKSRECGWFAPHSPLGHQMVVCCPTNHDLLDALDCKDHRGLFGASTVVVNFFKKMLSMESSSNVEYDHEGLAKRKKLQLIDAFLKKVITQQSVTGIQWLVKWFPHYSEFHSTPFVMQVLRIAIDQQDLHVVGWLLLQQDQQETSDKPWWLLHVALSDKDLCGIMQQAIDAGGLEIVRLLCDLEQFQLLCQRDSLSFSLDQVAMKSNLDVIQYLVECANVGLTCSSQAIEQVCWKGDSELLLFLSDNDLATNLSMKCLEKASEQGHLQVVRFLISRLHFFELLKSSSHTNARELTSVMVSKAIRHGHVHIMRFFLEHRVVDNTTIVSCLRGFVEEASANGHFAMVKFLLHEFSPRPENNSNGYDHQRSNLAKVVSAAIVNGDLETIRFLHNHQVLGFGTDSMDEAAARGFLEIVQYLHHNRSEGCTTKAMDSAAKNGFLDIVKFLHVHRQEGCTKHAMDDAAKFGHLRIVQFLHEHRHEGCTTRAMDEASRRGDLRMVKFLHANRPEGCTKFAMDDAAREGHFRIVRFLHAHRQEGCTTAAMDYAAGSNGDLAMVKFLHDYRQEGCTRRAMDDAAANGFLHILRFLHSNRDEGCSPKALNEATLRGHADVVRWLLLHRTEGNLAEALQLAKWSRSWNRNCRQPKEPMEQVLQRYQPVSN